MGMVIVSSNGEPPADRISQWDSSAPVWMSSLSKSSLSDFLNWFLGQESQKTDSYHLGAMDPVDTNMDDRRKIGGRNLLNAELSKGEIESRWKTGTE